MGMHDVMLDDDAALAALDEIAGGGEGRPAPPGVGQLVITEPTPSEWAAIAKMASEILANQVCPNWQVPPATRQEWADALDGCLDALFPGGLANIANWGPWAKLAYATVMWGMCGVDWSTGKMKPLREPKEGEDETPAPEVSAVAAAAAGGRHIMG